MKSDKQVIEMTKCKKKTNINEKTNDLINDKTINVYDRQQHIPTSVPDVF